MYSSSLFVLLCLAPAADSARVKRHENKFASKASSGEVSGLHLNSNSTSIQNYWLMPTASSMPWQPPAECMTAGTAMSKQAWFTRHAEVEKKDADQKAKGCLDNGKCQWSIDEGDMPSYARECGKMQGRICRLFVDYHDVDMVLGVNHPVHITAASARPFTAQCLPPQCDVKIADKLYTCSPLTASRAVNGVAKHYSFPCTSTVQCDEPCQLNANGNCIQLFDKPTEDAVVFVVDVSGSMSEGAIKGQGTSRLALMKSQLAATIQGLSMKQSFAIFKFSSSVTSWKDGSLKEANNDNIQDAVKWLQASRADGQTNIQEALKKASQVPKVSAIYFLTDGAPTVGCDRLDCMGLDSVPVPVHSVVFTDEQAAKDLMKGISQKTHGTFREPLQE